VVSGGGSVVCGRGLLGRGRAIVVVVIAIDVAPGGVYDTNVQVTIGEIFEESLCEVELTPLGAGGALIDTRGDGRLSVVGDSELLATASTVAELIVAHGDKVVAVLVVFARTCVWSSVGGVPSHLPAGIGVAFLY